MDVPMMMKVLALGKKGTPSEISKVVGPATSKECRSLRGPSPCSKAVLRSSIEYGGHLLIKTKLRWCRTTVERSSSTPCQLESTGTVRPTASKERRSLRGPAQLVAVALLHAKDCIRGEVSVVGVPRLTEGHIGLLVRLRRGPRLRSKTTSDDLWLVAEALLRQIVNLTTRTRT